MFATLGSRAATPPGEETLTDHLTSYSDIELVTLAENHPACQHPLAQEVLTRLARRAGHMLGLRDQRTDFQRDPRGGRSGAR